MRALLGLTALVLGLSPGVDCTGERPGSDAETPGAGEDAVGPQNPLPSLPRSAEIVATRRVGKVGPLPTIERATTLRGALQRDASDRHRFHSHTAIAAAAVDDAWVLVLARSGLWLAERATLAIRARLETDASGDVAVNRDHRLIAFGRCPEERPCSLEVRGYPSFEPLFSIEIDRPHRIRFSPDGSRIAIASTKNDSATIVDIRSQRVTHRLREPSDVNDVVILPFGNAIAYATNEDETIVHDLDAGRDVWRHKPRAGGAHPAASRDQNAIAYDEARDTLYTGGNDDTVWAISGLRTGSPRFLGPVASVGNDVLDLGLLPSGDLVIGADSGTLDVFSLQSTPRDTLPKTTRRLTLGASQPIVSWGARVVVAGPELVAVLGGTALRWEPTHAPEARRGCLSCAPRPEPMPVAVRAERFAFHGADDWTTSEGDADLVLVEMGLERRLLRVSRHPPDPLDVRPEVLGQSDLTTTIARLGDGTRVIVSLGTNGSIRVQRLPPGGALSTSRELTGFSALPGHFVEADGKRVAYVDGSAAIEIDAQSERRLADRAALESVVWDSRASTWNACASRCRVLR